MDDDDPPRFQERRPVVVRLADTGARLVGVETNQVDPRRPTRGNLRGAALMHLDPIGEARGSDVLFEMLA